MIIPWTAWSGVMHWCDIDGLKRQPDRSTRWSHCRGRTILMRRQNVTAGCLNFAKSHFAIPDSGVAWLWQNFNKILAPWENNLVAAVSAQSLPSTMLAKLTKTWGERKDAQVRIQVLWASKVRSEGWKNNELVEVRSRTPWRSWTSPSRLLSRPPVSL